MKWVRFYLLPSESVFIMQRLELSGWLGLLIIIASSLAVLFLVLILPSMVATALWNALIYETLGGPVVGLQQGFLLWSLVCVVLYAIFRPSIQVVLDEADLAKMEDVDFKFRKAKSSKEKTLPEDKQRAKKTEAKKLRPSSLEAERFSQRSPASKEKAPAAPSAHWLKWRKQQAEALQAEAEAKLLAKKQVAKKAEEDASSTKP
jgi:hypothetical protein